VYNSWKTCLISLKFFLKLEHRKFYIKSKFQLSITLLSDRILHYTTKCRRTLSGRFFELPRLQCRLIILHSTP
jgi:hypothetical protein